MMTVVAGTWFVLETTGSAAKVGLISAALAGFVIEGVGLRPTNLGMGAIYLAVTVMAKSDVNKTPEVDAYRIKLKHPFEAEVQALREVLRAWTPDYGADQEEGAQFRLQGRVSRDVQPSRDQARPLRVA